MHVAFARAVLLAMGLAVCSATMAPEQSALTSMHRGVNAYPWLYRVGMRTRDPRAFDFSHLFPSRQDFKARHLAALRLVGFDFIRIPLDPSPLLAADPAQRSGAIETMIAEAHKATREGMIAIIDFHPRESDPDWSATDILKTPDLLAAYSAALVEVARTLAARNEDRIVLELMNEPPGGWGLWDSIGWPGVQQRLVRAVRVAAPNQPLIVSGDEGGGIDGLMHIDARAIDDPNIIYSFHYYDPMVVTHQGATWTHKAWRKYIAGIAYPPAPQDEAESMRTIHDRIFADTISADEKSNVWADARKALGGYYHSATSVRGDFARVSAWAKANGVPPSRILLGEFGVLRPGASAETAANYDRDVRLSAEDAGFAWACFNFAPHDDPSGGFSLLRMQGHAPDAFEPDIMQRGLGMRLPQ
jgi:endoglucanase